MAVISLHELCKQELRHLLEVRYCPVVWTREGDLKVSLRIGDALKVLTLYLPTKKDMLLVRPVSSALAELHRRATKERTIKAMVERFVDEMAELPVPDQADAYAVSELRERGGYLNGLRGALEEARNSIATKVGTAGVAGVDFDEILDQLDNAIHKTVAEYDRVHESIRVSELGL